MSEQRPYIDEQGDDVPLPDSETSWQKMELLLDKDKKRRLLPFWLRYAALGLIFIGVGGGMWYLLNKNNTTGQTAQSPKERKPHEDQPIQDKQNNTSNEKQPLNEKPVISPNKKAVDITKDETKENNIQQNSTLQKQSKFFITQAKAIEKRKISRQIPSEKIDQVKNTQEGKLKNKNPDAEKKVVRDDKDRLINSTNSVPKTIKDSVTKKDTVATTPAPPLANNNDGKKEQKNKKHNIVLSAGIGLQQSILFNGQQTSSYNYKGKQGSVSDHIPSVYFRLDWRKWFLQTEFNYAVPQPVKTIAFSQMTRYDASLFSLNTERIFMQKLYYHQLPVSINYKVFSQLSVGAGGVYNLLAGAVTQQEIKQRNVLTGEETITKNLAPVKGYKDSFLYKSTVALVLQTDYHWKRFSLGLRYTKNLQPFIKYTLASGEIMDEKNQALQAILRFRLWKNGK